VKLLALESDDPLIETVLEVVNLPEVFPPLEDADFRTPHDAVDLYIKLGGMCPTIVGSLGVHEALQNAIIGFVSIVQEFYYSNFLKDSY
jgi:hypothetical protein